MREQLGIVRALFRYPVKSMAGQKLSSALLSWHGIEGDRRFAFVREGQADGFPWLTASKVPSLILYQPYCAPAAGDTTLPTLVRTPAGEELELEGDTLRRELATAYGADVRLMHLNQGTFDEAPLSLITTATVKSIAHTTDARRFRPNILVETAQDAVFPEDQWVGRLVAFGEGASAPMINVTSRDVRCGMINLDPETARVDPEVLKTAVRSNQNCAGVYASTLRRGTVSVGDGVYLVDV
ncbi:MAG: MOSC domain-containing protein [Acidobacteriota bacterium]